MDFVKSNFESFTNLKNYYIFCLWIWILTVLYYYDVIPFSLIYLSFFALLFTIYHKIIPENTHHILRKIQIIVLETVVLYVNWYKHFVINKSPLFVYRDMVLSLVLFAAYLYFLEVNGKTFYQYYFVELL